MRSPGTRPPRRAPGVATPDRPRRAPEARPADAGATATLVPGRAVRARPKPGNADPHHLLRKAVHIHDGTTGTVRLKTNVKQIEKTILDSVDDDRPGEPVIR